MPVTQASVTLSTSATPLFSASQSRRRIMIHNASGATVYVGGSGVTTTTGRPIADGETFEVTQAFPTDSATKYTWYGIASTGTPAVRVIEVTG